MKSRDKRRRESLFRVFVDAHEHFTKLEVANDDFVVEACQEPALEKN